MEKTQQTPEAAQDDICQRMMNAFQDSDVVTDTDLFEVSKASRDEYLEAVSYLLEETNEIYEDFESDLPYAVYRKTPALRGGKQ